MNYESVEQVESKIAAGVTFLISRMSFGRRMDLMKRVRDLAREAAFRAAGAQAAGQLPAQLAPALHVQRLVDGLVAHMHHGIARELDPQPAGDLHR